MKFQSFSSQETKRFAGEFANAVLKKANKRKKGAFVIALSGELGAGKTTFVQGFARGLGIRRRIMSPTFVFVRRYRISRVQFHDFFHIDAYRVRSASRRKDDLKGLGFREVFENPHHLVLVEWAENIRGFLPKDAILVKMKHVRRENERIIFI